jgi:ABC-type glycerol-3-phosphate transport system permease component
MQMNGKNRKFLRTLLFDSLRYLIIMALGVLFLLPFLWMVSASLKTTQDLVQIPQPFFPKAPMWTNYPVAWTSAPFTRWTINTVLMTAARIIGTLVSCSLVAYGFAFTSFRGRDFLFVVLLGTMMVPYQVTLIPSFVLFHHIGWVNTYLPLTVPWFLGDAFYIFLLRQFFLTLPKELSDAARIDGCSSLGIYWRIVMALSRPALAAVTAFTFIGSWNDFMGPLIYLRQDKMLTLSVGLRSFLAFGVDQAGGTDIPLLMAASVATLQPILLVFFFAQRYFVEGITFTGLKG